MLRFEEAGALKHVLQMLECCIDRSGYLACT